MNRAVLHRSLALAALVSIAHQSRADTIQTFQSWTAAFLQGRTENESDASPGIWLDVQARRQRDSTVALLRPGAGWYFDRRFSLWAGYLFAPTFVDGGPDRFEHRPWEQFQAVLTYGGTVLTFRSRFEQRFVHDARDVGFRVRQLVRGQQQFAEEWAFVVWDELFVGLNETDFGQPAGFDQNRVFLGPAWVPQPSLRVEVGYLSVLLPRPVADTFVHALSVNFFGFF